MFKTIKNISGKLSFFYIQLFTVLNENIIRNSLLILINYFLYKNSDISIQFIMLYMSCVFFIPVLLLSCISGQIVDKYNVQFSNYLAGLSQGQRTKMIELYCKNASPAKIFTFLKDNLSFYQTILNSAGTKLNMYKDDIFKLLKGKESNTVALATELGIDIMEYAKTNKEEAPDLAIVTKNTELARNILLNPGFYNYQPGSSVHQKLLELASSPKHDKKSDNSEMGNNLQIKA